LANNSGKRRSRLANMSLPGQREQAYRPPPVPPADQVVYPIELGPDDELRVRLVTYRSRIVDFAIMQFTRSHGVWVEVARVDCCGGSIHRHQFDQTGVDLFDHKVITPILRDGSEWDKVQAGYDIVLDDMMDRWQDNLRRWLDG
jgi:hypothetical protein